MSKDLTENTNNLIDMQEYRKIRDVRKLFTGYKERLSNMHKEEIEFELARIKKETENYPNHLLTKVKVQIFESATGIKL